ncbi:hypothetical protein D3C80_1810490 [compost metagenome]
MQVVKTPIERQSPLKARTSDNDIFDVRVAHCVGLCDEMRFGNYSDVARAVMNRGVKTFSLRGVRLEAALDIVMVCNSRAKPL